MTVAHHFDPHTSLPKALLPHAIDAPADAAHDTSHLVRVWNNVQAIVEVERGDLELLVAATLLLDCVHVPKGSPAISGVSDGGERRQCAPKAFSRNFFLSATIPAAITRVSPLNAGKIDVATTTS